MTIGDTDRFHLAAGWKVRRERFGGMAYHHRSGRLVTLGSKWLYEMVSCGDCRPVGETIDYVLSQVHAAERSPAELERARDRLLGAIETLVRMNLIVIVPVTSIDSDVPERRNNYAI
ncbi:MAG: hypothetical protein M1596_02955 [Firmicutes bacterium]|nr:hypothetical protein [Bacillota bacterium]